MNCAGRIGGEYYTKATRAIAIVSGLSAYAYVQNMIVMELQQLTKRRAWSDLLYDYEAGEWVIFCKACGRLTGYAPTRKIAIRERLKHTRQQCLGGY